MDAIRDSSSNANCFVLGHKRVVLRSILAKSQTICCIFAVVIVKGNTKMWQNEDILVVSEKPSVTKCVCVPN